MKTIGAVVLVALMILSVAAFGVHAFGMMRNDAAASALESGDYTAWKAAMVDSLTEQEFARQQGVMTRRGEGRGQRGEHMQEVFAALESGDYDAWKAAMGDKPGAVLMLNKVTEDNFSRFVQMHEARQSGDKETADAIAEELGIEQPLGDCMGKAHGGRGRMISKGG